MTWTDASKKSHTREARTPRHNKRLDLISPITDDDRSSMREQGLLLLGLASDFEQFVWQSQCQRHSQKGRRSWRDERPQIKAAPGRADRAQPPPVPDQGRSRSARAGDRLAVQLP